MDVTQATQTTSNAAAQQTEPSSSGLAANSDFETFLKLLTTQMENQDPLKPLESTEFVAQLASFSAVEQQILTNTRLNEISGALTSSQASTAADWLGKRVLSPSATSFSGSSIDVSWHSPPGATRSTLEVIDQSGTKVASAPVSVGQSEYSWDGTLDDGTVAPNGSFTFQIKHFDGDELVDTSTGMTYNEVLEVQIEANGLQLILDSGATTSVDRISRISTSSVEPNL